MNMRTERQKTPRPYSSDLRAEQADATRRRILDAVRTMLADGATTMSYAALARVARVAVPTIYRHFPTRAHLFEAIYQEAEPDLMSLDAFVREVRDSVSMRRSLREFFVRFDDPEDVYARASRLGAVWEFSRATTVPRRTAVMAALLDQRAPGLSEPTRTQIIDLAVVLVSSATAEMMRGYLDRSGAETADRVALAIEALLTYAATLATPKKPRRRAARP